MQDSGKDEGEGKSSSPSSRGFGFEEENVGIGLEGWILGDVLGDGSRDLMALPGSGAAENVRIGDGEMIDVEQVLQVNRRFTVSAPALQSQTVFQSSSLPVASFYQHPLSAISGMQSYVNYKMAETPKCEMIENQEISISSASDLRIRSSSGATLPPRKRKLVSQRHICCSNVSDGSKNASFETLPMRIQGCSACGLASILKQSLSPSLVHHAGHLNLESLGRSGNDKVVEERGWTMILQKELRNSDVGSLGRIVLPKRDAEANLPLLSERNGVILLMEDMISPVIWEFKFRYWPNNQSRMYVMENTGGFVRSHKLQTGDFFIIYKEDGSGKYIVSSKRGRRPSFSTKQEEQNCTLQGKMKGGVTTQEPTSNREMGGGVGTQEPRSNREMGANCLPSLLDPSVSLPTGDLLLAKASVNATPMGPLYNVEENSGGFTQFSPSLSDFDPFVIPSDFCLL